MVGRSRPHDEPDLRPHLAALEAAVDLSSEQPHEAMESARRVARVVESISRRTGTEGVTGASRLADLARRVAEASEPELSDGLRQLVDALRGRIRQDRVFHGDVLIVEDDDVQARLLGLGLSKSGWQVRITSTAAEAEAILERGPVALVILDLVLPDRDGRNLLLQLREDPDILGTPIVVASAKSDPHVRAECLALGADGFLQKPFDVEELLTLISTIPVSSAGPVESTTARRNAGEYRILLAEDDEVAAKLLIYRLTREVGFEVVHAADGHDALETLKSQPFDIAILDVHLPGMDGFDILSRLRTSPALADLPVIMLTALSGERHAVRGLELGADDYIAKPFSPLELIARVRRLLTKPRREL